MAKPFSLPLLVNLIVVFLILASYESRSYSVGFGFRTGEGAEVWADGGNDGTTNSPSPSPDQNTEYIALQAFKSAITEDPHGILTNWKGQDVCSYKGVFCSNDDGKVPSVASIDLNHENLKGTLVKELSFLSNLSILHLNSNRFSGPIPSSLQTLASLSELDLSNNRFSGSFPTTVLSIPNLFYLDLRYNDFSGPIPENLFDNKLDAIFLNNNQFSGQIPSNLGNSPASVISFANNNFSGQIPFSFGFMGPKLKEILFLNNTISGCIPEGIGILQDLQVLDLSLNSLMGHLPDTMSCLGNIEILNLGHNKLSGELSDLVCSLKNLLNLTVSNNFFSGLSSGCGKLGNSRLDFSSNCVGGKNKQRPQDECSLIPGKDLSCIRVPGGPVKPIVCHGAV